MNMQQSVAEGGLAFRREMRSLNQDTPPLSKHELDVLNEKRMIAQVILAARYAKKQMLDTLQGAALQAAQEAFSIEWMENAKTGQSFFRGVRRMTDIATGELTGTVSSEERTEALRFVRGLIELGNAIEPQMQNGLVVVQLTPREEQLADELQSVLDRIEPKKEGVEKENI